MVYRWFPLYQAGKVPSNFAKINRDYCTKKSRHNYPSACYETAITTKFPPVSELNVGCNDCALNFQSCYDSLLCVNLSSGHCGYLTLISNPFLPYSPSSRHSLSSNQSFALSILEVRSTQLQHSSHTKHHSFMHAATKMTHKICKKAHPSSNKSNLINTHLDCLLRISHRFPTPHNPLPPTL